MSLSAARVIRERAMQNPTLVVLTSRVSAQLRKLG